MTHSPVSSRLRAGFLAAAAGALLLLAGCATALSTRVTRFNAWPADAAGSTFSFRRPDDVRSTDLEQSTYEQYVREALERRGLRGAEPGKAGQLLVEVAASGGQRQQAASEPVYQSYQVFVPARRDAAGRWFPGYWATDLYGPQYLGERASLRTVDVNSLRLRIVQTRPAPAAPQSVFEATAVYEGGMSRGLPDMVPNLVAAIFADFPGQNGQTQVVRIDPRTSQPAGR
jgi:hypothetical protein